MQRNWTVPGYRHLRELGRGASGHVVMAVHEETSIEVAIKYLAPELAMDPDFVLRFRDEAQALSELEDPHVVQFFEYVETSTSAAVVLELIDGVGLAHVLADSGPMPAEAAMAVLKGALLGLAAAHASGVVHRDFKPANVLVDGHGQTYLTDFGIALPVAPAHAGAVGTSAYLAPELWDGGAAGPTADVYAATAVAFECMTGRPPYLAASPPEWAEAHRSAPVPVDRVPEGLRALVAAGLAKDVRERPQSAFAFLLELEMTAGAVLGAGWEEHGRAHLRDRALALAMLFPISSPADFVATEPLALVGTPVAGTEVLELPAPSAAAASATPAGRAVPPIPAFDLPAEEPYRPSKRLGLAAATAGALASLALLSGAVYLVDSVTPDLPTSPQAAPSPVASPTARAGGQPAPSPTGAAGGDDRLRGPVVVVTADPAAETTETPTASPQDPTPTETDSPDPDPTDPTESPDPTEEPDPDPTDPTESPDPTEEPEPTEEPSAPEEPEPTTPAETEEPEAPAPTPTEEATPKETTKPFVPTGLRVLALAARASAPAAG
ncbi:hypothetical protein GCM10022221_20010 [Actinocorallia aurea]